MTSRTYSITLEPKDGMDAVPVPFDPKEVFGSVRAPVKVTLNGYTYRSTIFKMHGEIWIPLRKSHREAAGLKGGETIEVIIALDTEERVVDLPPDLDAALTPKARAVWDRLSFTHKREHAEAILDAKREETRVRRVGKAVEMLEALHKG